MELIIQIIAGLLGGNAAGAAAKNVSLGTAGNSVVGGVGGLLGGLLANWLGGAGGAGIDLSNLDIGALVQSLAGGGIGGAILTVIAGMVKKALVK
ncbi:hypothetical protein [Tabrizicola sp.]|jgi:hypothetical protein|uniref:hypothetical protein n=1 Tax=Tabrizicola sp. TaxID=2005166 RepID=UPI0025E69D68|nr:hypothetical protein [Tabrizicola sp.]